MSEPWTPMRAELPLDGLEAFRLASFGIEYVPRSGLIVMDSVCAANGWFSVSGATWEHMRAKDAVLAFVQRVHNRAHADPEWSTDYRKATYLALVEETGRRTVEILTGSGAHAG